MLVQLIQPFLFFFREIFKHLYRDGSLAGRAHEKNHDSWGWGFEPLPSHLNGVYIFFADISITFDTDITDDVIGYLTDEEVISILKQISELS